MAFKSKDGKREFSMASQKSIYDRVHKAEGMGGDYEKKSTILDAPSDDSAEEGETPEASSVVSEHGMAHHVEIMHPKGEGGGETGEDAHGLDYGKGDKEGHPGSPDEKHHVHSDHADGHHHHSMHDSAEEAHEYGKELATSTGEEDGGGDPTGSEFDDGGEEAS